MVGVGADCVIVAHPTSKKRDAIKAAVARNMLISLRDNPILRRLAVADKEIGSSLSRVCQITGPLYYPRPLTCTIAWPGGSALAVVFRLSGGDARACSKSTHAHPESRPAGAATTTGTATAATPAPLPSFTAAAFTPALTAVRRRPRWALHGDFDIGGNGCEAKRLADEVAQGNDQLGRVHLPFGNEFLGRSASQANMLIGAE